jgi:holo-[acyl-carrier protein] synthase
MASPFNIGVDIVAVARFETHLEPDDSLVHRIFSPDELQLIPFGPTRANRLAGRWAAKEAVAKALGCGFGEELSFRDIEILNNTKGAPIVRLTDTAAERHNHPTLVVSITHDGDYAAAVAASS